MYILTQKNLRMSARKLAEKLRERTNKPFLVTTDPEGVGGNYFIRWGNSYRVLAIRDTTYNDPGLIRTCSNKVIFANRMAQLEIPAVNLNRGRPEKFPVVIRKVLTGSRGVGIEVCTSLDEFNSKYSTDFWSYWHPFSIELGAHIFNGKIIKLFKKERDADLPNEEFPIRNSHRGYHFSRVNPINFPRLIPLIENFYSKFPIAFGRLDIGWDSESRIYKIIEMNSAPGLAENEDTLNSYVDSFVEVLK